MSKRKSSTILDARLNGPAEGWRAAVAEAENLIRQHETRIAELKRAVKAFETMKAHNEPFPGSSVLLGQDSDL